MKVHIRWIIRGDMVDVESIENSSFEHPWQEEDFIKVLRTRNCIGIGIGMVATEWDGTIKNQGDGRVVGFMVYEIHKTRLHLLDLAVPFAERRKGVGRALIEKLIGKLSSQRRTRITLEIRETNLSGQKFFSAMGFKAVTVMRAYYEDDVTVEAAYLMQYRETAAIEPMLPFDRIDKP